MTRRQPTDLSLGQRALGAVVSLAVSMMVFWYLGRRHDTGPLGMNDVWYIALILGFVLLCTFPDRVPILRDFIARTKLGRDG